ncbi:polyketide-type polyunsaturated fatty acid synthase PfaA [Chitinophaga sp. CF118]|uniref:type I polyketide synthase n=1 Tax=Chitinophaga sp. CF118 TaxID=1884367 RepID=UPI0008E38CE5|nr:type I polyketide synthase [Chitinophaga sp. CF118]SFE77110.1 polyketide-type polyunsaturated fatty acid synthase PfaA [Chitinophaga sp. CF118]
MKTPAIIGITPFESPDVKLALALAKAKAFPVLHLGRNKALAIEALKELTLKSEQNFGVCFSSSDLSDLPLPEQVSIVIAPYGIKLATRKNVQLFYQVHNLSEALLAKADKADGIIVKGNESAGKTGEESAYILFQQVVKALPNTNIWVQGGAGIHTTAALIATGAKGVILDSQLVLFPECNAPAAIKNVCEKLNGNETRIIDNFRVLVRPNSPVIPENAQYTDLEKYLGPIDLDKGLLPLGQDIAISIDLVKRYKKLSRLITGMLEGIRGHLHQAKTLNVISPGNALAQELNIPYPIAQGPMTRVSDVPAFAEAVANAGALPFVALSLLKGESALQLIQQTKQLAGDKTWGVGILGFAPQELRDEQIEYIKQEKPPIVLIAGGRPSQSKALEQMGIKSFLHVPSASLLDMFLKEGARRFVFEGRECGGHVGPLSSLVLWEKQIDRLLLEDHADQLNIFFAGGIHDSLSTAFISVMAAPLATKGAKIGVLMGTAYIYTKEAVESGAILQQFQDQAISHTSTVLLETAPGHETRCLQSPFTHFFNEEKRRLITENLDKKEIWGRLEQLNVGRLRIAAKGLDRKENDLVTVDLKQQVNDGMYMIGQVAALRNEIVSMTELHKEVAENNFKHIQAAVLPAPLYAPEKALDVAIIGMACIYPGAKNIEEYWSNILEGKDCVTEVPDERWNKSLYWDQESTDGNKTPSKWGGFIPRIDFDPVAFGIPPQSLAAIDPTQLLSLLVAKQALENAGYGNKDFNAEDVSVIIGAEGGNDLANNYGFRSLYRQIFGEMPAELDDALPKLTEDSFPGVLANVISGRITNRLNLGGRNYTVDAACASSLAAIDLACQELILEKSDMVLAGAADLHNGINDYLMFSSTHALSKTGRCATFDSAADGIALGEGVAMVVLKRLADAKRDGDKIYAVIKGVGGSSDGKSLGLTAPRKAGQIKALERAYEQSGVSPAALGLVEAHGTGTVVGDKTELSAISDMLIQSGAVAGQAHLGSVKTQIGHTKCAAGLAGLIKAALSVYHGVKPPTLHIKAPNSYYNASTSPFLFNTEAGLWMDDQRLAGVSAFGFGGTNFHAVIENEGNQPEDNTIMKSWPAELFVFRGDTQAAMKQLLQSVRAILENNDTISLKDIAYSLLVKNDQPILLSIVASNREDLMLKIELALSGATAKEIYATQPLEGKVAFLFPGQGSQRINMARELFVAFPAMRRLLKNNPAYEKILFPNAVFNEDAAKKQKEQIKDTRVAQPLLGIVDLAIANFLKELGIQPDMVAGHSYGELPALCFANVFAENELVSLSEKRAKAILDAIEDDKGVMVAVNCSGDELSTIAKEENGVYPVNHNSPKQWVLAGTTKDMERLMEQLKQSNISYKQLEVACAFHSPLLSKSKALYKTAISKVSFNTPSIPVWSNTTTKVYPAAAKEIKELLTDHLVKPVRFTEEVEQMYKAGARVFIEVGPGKVLSGLTKAIIGKDELILHTEDKNAFNQLLSTIARYIASGRDVKLEKLFDGREPQQLQLDTPEQYKKSSTVWYVNGQLSVPSVGKLPAHGALPITEPLQLKGSEIRTVVTANGGAENMVQEYLSNMKYMMQAQRDVMLSFMGHVPQSFSQPQIIQEAPAKVIPVQAPVHQETIHVNIKRDPKKILIEVVSEKTGYPHEMLGMDMDMEADLSIDSIKRMEIIGELRTQLGGFKTAGKSDEAVVEQLAGIKTLNGLLQWIADNVDQSLPDTGGISLQHAVQQPAAAKGWTEQDIRSTILLTVSEKTGYPQEMLGLDLDLEADLSIDSIKRMEILGELKVKIGGFNQGEDKTEALAAIKTLNGLVNWIVGNMPAETATAVTVIEQTPIPKTKEVLSRIRFALAPSYFENILPAKLADQKFAITDDGSKVALSIKKLLEQQGASVNIITANDSLEGYNGLIILDILSTPNRQDILTAFSTIKKLDPKNVKWIYAISGIEQTSSSDTKQLRHFQGYPGFFKSLDIEWEQTKCRSISLTGILSPEEIASIALDEIQHPDQPSEVIYQDGKRHIFQLIPSQIPTGDTPNIQLDKNGVILVLGGAQGITSELMIRFSKDYPCHYILVGRSADPRNDGQNKYAAFNSKEDIKKQLIAEGQLTKPAEIEKRASDIHKSNQILHTITSLEANGATVTYHTLDLRNEQELSHLISSVYKEFGRIDGVIHGAGLLEDKLFQQKTSDSFERVFSTKVTPLRILAEQLRPDVQFVILFSSVASVYGNRGQTDYAAANSVMDRYAWELKKTLKGKVIAINWGPWKGTGMVSPTLEKEYERRGIPLIPLKDGMEIFVNELKYGNESQVLIMAE